MPKNFQKTKKKKKRKTPKTTREYYDEEKTEKRKCGLCGEKLHGVPHGKRSSEVRKLSKTQKRPSVPFGGVLCSKCRRKVIAEKIKIKNGLKTIEDLDYKTKKFVKQILSD